MRDSNSKNILAKLHLLPIHRRIQYKILTLIHKCLSGKAPEYLMKLLIHYPYDERRQDSEDKTKKRRLVEPKTKLKTLAA